jgi:hypothetical protein
LDEIRKDLQSILIADPEFGSFFDTDTKNPQILAFKDQTEKELLKIIEIALLDKFGYVGPSER